MLGEESDEWAAAGSQCFDWCKAFDWMWLNDADFISSYLPLSKFDEILNISSYYYHSLVFASSTGSQSCIFFFK